MELSTHVLDTTHGCPAAGMEIALYSVAGTALDILPRLNSGDSYRVQRGVTASLAHLGGFLLLTVYCTVHFTG